MTQLLIGSFSLSLVHALIPSHWLPIVAISKGEGWTANETLGATAVVGAAHVLSTIIIGVFIGLLGLRLNAHYKEIMHVVAPAILIGFGLLYLVLDIRHAHHHCHAIDVKEIKNKRSKFAILLSLSIAMFFSPCFEIEAYYFQAGLLGWPGILTVSVTFLLVTVLGMVLLVLLALRGIRKLKWNFIAHHERGVSGGVLIVLGVAAYLFHQGH